MNNPQIPPKAPNPIQAQQVADMKRRTADLRQAFEALEDGNVRSIPEGIFVRDFLPLFSGQDMTDRKAKLQTWYLIAGTPYIPVNVVDPAGNVIIQVPPLHDAAQLNPTAPEDASKAMGTAAEEAAQAARQAPRLGDAVLSRHLAGRIQNVQAPKEPSQQWQKVFDHYKVGPKHQKGAIAADGKPAEKAESSGFDYDFE